MPAIDSSAAKRLLAYSDAQIIYPERLVIDFLADARELARALSTHLERGLSTQEVEERLAASGRNELRAKPRVPRWQRFLKQFRDPLIYLLLAAVAISLIAWAIEGRGWPVDGTVIALIVLLNAILGYAQESKAENAVAALARMTAASSAVTSGL